MIYQWLSADIEGLVNMVKPTHPVEQFNLSPPISFQKSRGLSTRLDRLLHQPKVGCFENTSMIWHTMYNSQRSWEKNWVFLPWSGKWLCATCIHWVCHGILDSGKITELNAVLWRFSHEVFNILYTTWQKLEVRLPTGFAISPILFVLVMVGVT